MNEQFIDRVINILVEMRLNENNSTLHQRGVKSSPGPLGTTDPNQISPSVHWHDLIRQSKEGLKPGQVVNTKPLKTLVNVGKATKKVRGGHQRPHQQPPKPGS